MITQTIHRTLYQWHPVDAPATLYGKPIDLDSLIPDGMTLTLATIEGDTLTIRGEHHEGAICFYHLTGMGGTSLIGEWVKVSDEDRVRAQVAAFPSRNDRPMWAQKLDHLLRGEE